MGSEETYSKEQRASLLPYNDAGRETRSILQALVRCGPTRELL